MPNSVNSGKATPYHSNVHHNTVDADIGHKFGHWEKTGKGQYNLDKAYGLSSRPNEAERLAAENMKELYRNFDAGKREARSK